MYFALMGKLSARRQNLAEDKDKGFTLIELLVVVIIIGILAAIAIPVYLGVQNNAKDSSVKSDVSNAKTAVIAYQTSTGNLPTAADFTTGAGHADLVEAGLTQGANTATLTFEVDGDGRFCIEGTRNAETAFSATDTSGVVDGGCE